MDNKLQINPNDNVAVTLSDNTLSGISFGHKVAIADIGKGEKVIKYGFPIGVATADIRVGEHVHTHNIKSAISKENKYTYTPKLVSDTNKKTGTFQGYLRKNGNIGIRNEIWIINTVGCVNKISEKIAQKANEIFAGKVDGVYAVTHPYGCSQLSDDHESTRKILAGMANHPNTAGVLVLGLGCENNTISGFKNLLDEYYDYDKERIKFLTIQECDDEISSAIELIGGISDIAKNDKRVQVGLDKLVIGLKCGGSDAFSGITANPLAGIISNKIIEYGGSAVLTETPEMFGAETILMNRCKSEVEFNKTVAMVNSFKQYFIGHGQNVYENPSPGNKAGGITTLEEKSLGCIQKGGNGTVMDVLAYGEKVTRNGLNLLDGPGNDIVSTTALTAAGCHLILFTTGRGTPLGAFAPTLKISTNSNLFKKKPHWIDYDAGKLLQGQSIENTAKELWELIINVIEGRKVTRSEENNLREFAIFKNGVTL